jgi:hypothetical protein
VEVTPVVDEPRSRRDAGRCAGRIVTAVERPVPAGVAVAQYLLRDLVAVVADQNGAEDDTNRFSLLGP